MSDNIEKTNGTKRKFCEEGEKCVMVITRFEDVTHNWMLFTEETLKSQVVPWSIVHLAAEYSDNEDEEEEEEEEDEEEEEEEEEEEDKKKEEEEDAVHQNKKLKCEDEEEGNKDPDQNTEDGKSDISEFRAESRRSKKDDKTLWEIINMLQDDDDYHLYFHLFEIPITFFKKGVATREDLGKSDIDLEDYKSSALQWAEMWGGDAICLGRDTKNAEKMKHFVLPEGKNWVITKVFSFAPPY